MCAATDTDAAGAGQTARRHLPDAPFLAAARRETDRVRLEAMAGEVDDLAGSIARHALNRPTEPRTLGAATVAIEAARSTVRRALAAAAPPARSGTTDVIQS